MSHYTTHAVKTGVANRNTPVIWLNVFRYNGFPLYNGKSVKGELLTRPTKNVARHVHVGHARLARGLHPHRPPPAVCPRIRAQKGGQHD